MSQSLQIGVLLVLMPLPQAMVLHAITQMASENDWTKNCDKAERLAREVAARFVRAYAP